MAEGERGGGSWGGGQCLSWANGGIQSNSEDEYNSEASEPDVAARAGPEKI